MADFQQFSKVVLIIILVTVSDSLVRANSVSRNEKMRSVVVGGVKKTTMTSSEDGSTESASSSTNSMEEQFLRRLGLERRPLRRSKRSEAMDDAVPAYLTEILREFQRQTRESWNRYKQTEEEDTIVTGVEPYKVFSVSSEMVKVYFHLNAVLKMESMALAEVVVRPSTLKGKEGRVNIRSLVFCREVEANDNSISSSSSNSSNSSSTSNSSNSCRILAHKPVASPRHFDIYDITRSLQDLRTELSSMSGSDGGDCSGCSIVMTMTYAHRGDSSDVTSGLSDDVLLVVSNQPIISDPVLSDNSVETVRQKNGRIDQSERTQLVKDSKIAVELRDTKRDTRRRRRQRRAVGCSLGSWYLDFTRLGWSSWIRFPLGYYANYCSGSCISPSQGNPGTNMTNHAYVKRLYRAALQNNNGSASQAAIDALPAACCVPVRLSPVNILYRNDDDNWIIRSMSEMIADQCACL